MGFGFVAMQMVVVSLPILMGWAANKLGFLNDELDAGLSRLVMNIGLPCTILSSLNDAGELPASETLVMIILATLATYVAAVAVAYVLVALVRPPADARTPYRFSIAFGNCGFIGLPVISAIFGDEAMLYAAIALIPANFALFSVGALMFSGADGADGAGGLARRLRQALASLKSPTLIASVAVFVLAVVGVGNLGFIGDSLGIVGQMTTPLALLVTGSSMAKSHVRTMVSSWRSYVAALGRLVLVPVAALAVARLFPLDPFLLGIVVVDCSMPVATVGTLFCLQNKIDPTPMLQVTFLSIIGSIVSIPAVTVLVGA